MNASERFCTAYAKSRTTLPGQQLPWLKALRENSLEFFSREGLPSPMIEDWKYTRLKKIEEIDFIHVDQPDSASYLEQPHELPSLSDKSHRLVFIDGWYREELSTINHLPRGVILCNLTQAIQTHGDLLEAQLGRIASTRKQPFAVLNTMFMSDGLFIYIPKSTTTPDPIHCMFISTTMNKSTVSHPRLLIMVEDNSEVTVIEHYLGMKAQGVEKEELNHQHALTNALTEVQLGPYARMNHYKLQCESLYCSHIAGIHVEQQRASHFNSHNFSLGAALARNDLQIMLNDEGAECSLNGAYLVGGRQHIDHHTQVDHAKPGCRSDELYKGIIQDRARAVFNGRVIVHPEAQKSDAKQINKNLLLSEKAEVDTKPELQIYADDVKCSHGATVGQLDSAALFYLQSRGINKADSEALLAYAFVSDILQRIDQTAIQQFIQAPLLSKLGKLVGGNVDPLQELGGKSCH